MTEALTEFGKRVRDLKAEVMDIVEQKEHIKLAIKSMREQPEVAEQVFDAGDKLWALEVLEREIKTVETLKGTITDSEIYHWRENGHEAITKLLHEYLPKYATLGELDGVADRIHAEIGEFYRTNEGVIAKGPNYKVR